MQVNKRSSNPRKRCHNCGLPCNGMFCCEWCLNTYWARQAAHRVADQRRERSQSNKGSTPGIKKHSAGDQRDGCGAD